MLAPPRSPQDELHLDPAQMSILVSAASLPWLIKPLYGTWGGGGEGDTGGGAGLRAFF